MLSPIGEMSHFASLQKTFLRPVRSVPKQPKTMMDVGFCQVIPIWWPLLEPKNIQRNAAGTSIHKNHNNKSLGFFGWNLLSKFLQQKTPAVAGVFCKKIT
jgi:hypothetical protein